MSWDGTDRIIIDHTEVQDTLRGKNASATAAIFRTVETCPSGALAYFFNEND